MDYTTTPNRARKNLDRRLTWLRHVDALVRPPRGWIRAIRDALGLTAAKLGERMQVSQPTITELEKAEVEKRITLGSLERAAEAMGCTLVYALVPRRPLEEMVQERALQVASEILAGVDHTMQLEAQGMDAGELDEERARLASKLVHEKIRSLWKQSQGPT